MGTLGVSPDDAEAIRQEQVAEIDCYYASLVYGAAEARERAWQRDFSSPDAYRRSVAPNRERFLQLMGGAPRAAVPLKPRQQELPAHPGIAARRVWLPVDDGVCDEVGVHAYGVLLVPSEPAGPKPAVIAQHGFSGSPEATCGYYELDETAYLRDFGLRLAQKGYVVFAPLVMNNTPDRSRTNRKATLIARQLMGLEVGKMMRVVDFLQTLPEVDNDRIGYMGISQGGMMALWAAAADERIAACVCSGYFTSRTPKMIDVSPHYTSFIVTGDDDKFFWGQLNEFSDSDIASLICPRPFFVEAGTEDRVFWLEHVKEEFAQLQSIYARLGIPERVELGIFEGPHVIHAVESFAFLDRWLKG